MVYKYICKLDKKICICERRLDNDFCNDTSDWRYCPHMMENIFNLE